MSEYIKITPLQKAENFIEIAIKIIVCTLLGKAVHIIKVLCVAKIMHRTYDLVILSHGKHLFGKLRVIVRLAELYALKHKHLPAECRLCHCHLVIRRAYTFIILVLIKAVYFTMVTESQSAKFRKFCFFADKHCGMVTVGGIIGMDVQVNCSFIHQIASSGIILRI